MTTDLNLSELDQTHSIHDDIKQASELLASANAKLDGTYPAPMPASVEMPDLFPKMRDWDLIPLGVGSSGGVVNWDVKEAPHMLITGTTGSGKNSAARTVCLGGAASGHRVVLVDTVKNGQDFGGIAEDWIFCDRTSVGLASAYETITYCQKESHRRIDLNSEHSVPAWYDLPREVRPRPILLVIEEFFSMVEPEPGESPETKEENEMKQDIQLLCNKIGREARASGVHMVLITQRPDASAIKGNLIANLEARLLLGPADNTMRQMTFVDPQAAPKLEGRVPAGRGVFMQRDKGEIVQIFNSGDSLEVSLMLARAQHRIEEMFNLGDTCLPPACSGSSPAEDQPDPGETEIARPKRSIWQERARRAAAKFQQTSSHSRREPVAT